MSQVSSLCEKSNVVVLHSRRLVAVVLRERAREQLSQLQCGCLRQPELALRL